MFDEVLRVTRQLDGSRFTIEVPLDEDGYFDRQCPNEDCEAEFKVSFEDWRDKVSDDQVFCPVCREEARATEWNTPEQAEHIRQVGLAHIQKVMGQAMERDARKFNARQPRSGFVRMSLSVDRSAPVLVMSIEAATVLRQKFTCEICGCRYSSLTAAFFCPACGHNSAKTTFEQTLETVRNSLAALPHLKDVMTSELGPQGAENFARELREGQLGRLVTAFQGLAEALFEERPTAAQFPRRQNVFQNLRDGSALWRQATGRGYEDLLSTDEMAEMQRLFQQRHLLEHREGIVDATYIARSADQSYATGQRLVIRESAVLRLAELVEKLTAELRRL